MAGPLFLLMGLGMMLGIILQPDLYSVVMKNLSTNASSIWILSAIFLCVGLAILNAHSAWTSDWRSLITIMGWLIVLRGAIGVLFTLQVQEVGMQMVSNGATGSFIGAFGQILIGIIFIIKGFFHD